MWRLQGVLHVTIIMCVCVRAFAIKFLGVLIIQIVNY